MGLLEQKAAAVVEALSRVELLAPSAVAARARDVWAQCFTLERLALKRAVLRSAISKLEANWCPRNAERCQDSHHASAFVAWELLVDWGRLEDEERWENLDFLQYVLQDSRALDSEHVEQVLGAANCVTWWSEMIGGWVRDPLLERFRAVRSNYVDVAYRSLFE
ncbi:hypothetical protein OHT17_12020 [Streptomyces sp. NBC_00371]|uniref:hypothetical protein n=1 Tax=Streptomyces sp. NBC_00371 TaxID=2975729 RepID=UPI002E254ACD